MLLCQLCGLDLSSPIMLKDEREDDLSPDPVAANGIDLNTVYATRPEVRSLELATEIYKQKVNVTRSEYLPSLALMGSYMMTNPSVFNGFEKKFKGMWNVGVVLQVPIWHWGEGMYKVKAAKAEARIAQYQLDDAKEKIELQVNQSVFKVNEAAKKLIMAENDLTKENCMEMLRATYKQLERYPKKSDFTVEEVAAVKSYFGPWPRALEACGILPDRSAEREAAKLQKRIAAKRRQTQYKLERQGRLKEQTDDKKQ